MVKDNPYSTNISFLVSEQIPDHIRADNELYADFMTAYYEWLELKNNPLYMSEHLAEFTDIDDSPEYFFNHLKNEILSKFPQNVLADKRLLARFAKDFYEQKGTLASYKFLFKALYNEDISISLPKDYILKASDGQWVVDHYILCKSVKGDPFSLIGDFIYTNNKRVKLFVDNVVLQTQGKYEVYKIYVPTASNIELDVDQELENENRTVTVSTYGVIKNIEVTLSGNNYSLGEYIPIIDPYGVDGVAKIKKLKASNTIIGFKILNGGNNYRVGDQLVFTPVNGGFGAIAYVDGIETQSTINQCTTTIESEQSVITDDVKDIRVVDYLKYQNFETGAITSIKLVNGGRDYIELPTVSVYQKPLYDLPKGFGANIIALSKSYGQVLEIEVENHGVGYRKSDVYPIIDLSGFGDGKARAKANIYAGVISSQGYWKDNKGKLDSTVYLQDNYYYQNYSYVIKSSQAINDYKNIVLENVHLSGAQLFGEVNINETVNMYGIPAYNPVQFISITYNQHVFAGIRDFQQLVSVNINKIMRYADIYGTVYYIIDFANYSPSLYQDLELREFVAIYQDLLLWDLLDTKLSDILYTPLIELYGSTRNTAGHAKPAEITISKVDTGEVIKVYAE